MPFCTKLSHRFVYVCCGVGCERISLPTRWFGSVCMYMYIWARDHRSVCVHASMLGILCVFVCVCVLFHVSLGAAEEQ